MRTSLLAKATMTTFRCVRSSSCANQLPAAPASPPELCPEGVSQDLTNPVHHPWRRILVVGEVATPSALTRRNSGMLPRWYKWDLCSLRHNNLRCLRRGARPWRYTTLALDVQLSRNWVYCRRPRLCSGSSSPGQLLGKQMSYSRPIRFGFSNYFGS